MDILPGLKVNAVVRNMIAADFLLVSSTGFLTPILAVYVTQQITGGSIAAVGFATTIFWVVKSAAQIPVSLAADARKGEYDDFYLLLAGITLAGIVQLLYYLFAREVWHIYVLNVLDGLAYAMQVPTWLAIFTRHIDKHHEGTEWMLHSNGIGLGYAAAAALGGVLAQRFGFHVIFLVTAAFLFASAITLLALRGKLYVGDREDGDGMMDGHKLLIR